MYICVFVWLYATCVWMPKEAQRRYWIPWSWIYRWLWATWSESWEPNSGPLEEMPALLTIEPPLALCSWLILFTVLSVHLCSSVWPDNTLFVWTIICLFSHLSVDIWALYPASVIRNNTGENINIPKFWGPTVLQLCWHCARLPVSLYPGMHWLPSCLVLTLPKGCKVASYYECVDCFSSEWH